ncbi:MAG: peptidylprolyl isomerase [Cytophagales bacterium]|nr:MAG: peptidylprolyl isomerase [Cytophagales bacterium]
MKFYTLKAFIVSVFLIFVGQFQSLAQKGVVLDKIIAKVDNQILLKSELDLAYIQAINTQQEFKTEVTICKVLEQLMTNKLLLAKADIDSVHVEDKIVEAQLDRRMEYFISQIGSKEKLETQYGKSVKKLKDELRKQVKDQLLVQKMQESITAKVKVTPAEVRKFYSSIPKDSLPFFSKELEVGHIVKYPKVSKDQKIIVREKLNNLRKQIIEESKEFADLAKEFSEDPLSARDGGNLGFFKQGELVPEYEAAALKLKPGETSPVVESQFGFHIIQLIERRGNQFNSKHILLKPISSLSDNDVIIQELDSLRYKILNDSLKFEKAAKNNSDDKFTKESGGMMTDSESGSSKLMAERIDPALYFRLDTMKIGSITPPIPFRTDDGKDAFRIVYLKSVSPPHIANLKEDYQKIQFATIQEKKNKLINSWFNKTKSEVFVDLDAEYKDCEILKGEQF